MRPVQPSVVVARHHVMLSAAPSSGKVNTMIRITGIGDHDRPEWLIRINGLRTVEMVENGPIPAVHGVVRWRIIDLCQRLWEEYEVSVSKQTLSRELRAMGYRKLSARPRHHAQKAGAIETFKKTGLRRWRQSRAGEASIPTT
jgi:Winged helix-turn helix